eukprot:scaffold128487_cov51-Phaeocystis_antarctica.AAC.2
MLPRRAAPTLATPARTLRIFQPGRSRAGYCTNRRRAGRFPLGATTRSPGTPSAAAAGRDRCASRKAR